MKVSVDDRSVFFSTGSGRAPVDAPAIVFLHGAGFDHTVWVMPSRFFARHGFAVFSVDLPGHGRSDGPALTSVVALADWVQAFLDAVGVARCTLVGHSMGSLIALMTAARHPERIGHIALLGTSEPMPVTSLLLDAAADNDHAAIDMANAWSHSARGAMGRAENPGSHNLHHGERLLERAADGVFHADLAACNGFALPADAVLAQPALVIVGGADKMTPPKAGMAVVERLPQAQHCVLPNSGHSMLSECPNEVLDALASFILPTMS